MDKEQYFLFFLMCNIDFSLSILESDSKNALRLIATVSIDFYTPHTFQYLLTLHSPNDQTVTLSFHHF